MRPWAMASDPRHQTLRRLEGRYTVERPADARAAVSGGDLLVLVLGPDGPTSVIRDDAAADAWAALWNGDQAHDLEATGMLSAVILPLAAAELPVWVASSYDGDLVLVPQDRLTEAVQVLQTAGHHIVG